MVVLREGMCPGLDAAVLRDLRAADIKTVEELVCCDTEELAQRSSLSYKALLAIRRVLLAQHTAFPVSGADLYEELLSCTAILSTGNPSLDKLLDSGLHTGEVTELAGAPGSGKSQVCFGVAVHAAQHLRQSVMFVDTTGALAAGRLLQMLRAESCDAEQQTEALQRIHIFRVFDIFALLDCLFELRGGRLQQASVGGGSVKALIVDSVSAVLAPLLGGKHSQALSLMAQLAGVLKTTAKDFNVAVLVTNHVSRSSGGELQPSLGAFWSHVPRTRVLLERAGGGGGGGGHSALRSATLIKSSRQPCLLTEEVDLRWWSRSADGASAKRKLEQTDS